MSSLQYELLAGVMRFVFVPLFVFMLWRCAKNAYLEYLYEKEYFGDVGDRGEVMGYAALFDEWQDDDAWRPLYDDADIGSAADCSFRVKGHGLRAKHARVYFERGRAYVQRLCASDDVLTVNNIRVDGKMQIKEGDILRCAEAKIIVSIPMVQTRGKGGRRNETV